MAFVDPNLRVRKDIPNEPGQWVELRPLATGDYAFAQRGDFAQSAAEIAVVLLTRAITKWSYDRDITVETLNELAIPTFQWLRDEMQLVTDSRDEDAKKNLEPQPSDTSGPARESSLVSSATS